MADSGGERRGTRDQVERFAAHLVEQGWKPHAAKEKSREIAIKRERKEDRNRK